MWNLLNNRKERLRKTEFPDHWSLFNEFEIKFLASYDNVISLFWFIIDLIYFKSIKLQEYGKSRGSGQEYSRLRRPQTMPVPRQARLGWERNISKFRVLKTHQRLTPCTLNADFWRPALSDWFLNCFFNSNIYIINWLIWRRRRRRWPKQEIKVSMVLGYTFSR